MAVLKRTLPTAIAIAVGIFVLVSLFTPYALLDAFGLYFIDVAIIIAAFALFLGVINLLRVHARKLRERPSDRLFSFVLLVAMILVLVFGLPPIEGQPSGPSQPLVQWLFQNVQVPIQASLSALLVFLLITAAYRLLSLRNAESAVMLLVALLVLLGQAAVGLFPPLTQVRDWIIAVPAMAGIRGILLGVALGAILTGIRLLLGVERPYSE
ncbi:MAG: hypothetical protein P8129_01275 [Anaerolineae bacterium]|jgi:hypothetical protein